MANPDNHVKVENTSISITRMNLLVSIEDEDPGEEIVYTCFESSEGKKVVGRLIKYPRTELFS